MSVVYWINVSESFGAEFGRTSTPCTHHQCCTVCWKIQKMWMTYPICGKIFDSWMKNSSLYHGAPAGHCGFLETPATQNRALERRG